MQNGWIRRGGEGSEEQPVGKDGVSWAELQDGRGDL